MEDTDAQAKEQKQHKPLHADVSLHKTVYCDSGQADTTAKTGPQV